MTAYEEALAQKDKLCGKLRELRAKLEETRDSCQRMDLEDRRKLLRDMYRDACYQAERLRPAREKRYRGARTTVRTGSVSWDFFERCGTAWSDIEGAAWSELREDAEGAGEKNFLLEALRSAMDSLTDAQRDCLLAYEAGLTQEEIAWRRGTCRATISRNIRRGLKRLENCIVASLQARACAGPDGFDFLRFAETTDVLTERMREYLYLILTDPVKKIEIARYLRVNRGSLYVSSRRIEANLSTVRPGIPPPPASGNIVCRSEWMGKPEKELAARLGLSPAAYYRWACRGETVGGIPRIAYEVLRLGGLPAREAARRLGMSAQTVQKYRRKYAGVDISALAEPERYVPRQREKPDLRRLLLEAGREPGEEDGDAAT